MNFRIYFEFEKKGNEVPQNEIYENYNITLILFQIVQKKN